MNDRDLPISAGRVVQEQRPARRRTGKASCCDSDGHRHCQGRWRAVISLGFGPDGKRIRRKVCGKTKAIVQDRLKALHSDPRCRRAGEPELHSPARRGRLADGRPRRPVGYNRQEERERPRPDPGRGRRPATARVDRRGRAPGADGDGSALLECGCGHWPQRAGRAVQHADPGISRNATALCPSIPRKARLDGRATSSAWSRRRHSWQPPRPRAS